MNLLPEEYKKDLVLEAWRRYMVGVGPYLFVVMAIGVGLLLPSYFILQFQIRGLEQQFQVNQGSQEYQQLQKDVAKIKETDGKFKKFSQFEKTTKRTAPLVDDIFARVGSDITLTTFDYSQTPAGVYQILIGGRSKTRDAFLAFIDELKKSSFVKDVDSPISNLLQEKDTNFAITITLQP